RRNHLQSVQRPAAAGDGAGERRRRGRHQGPRDDRRGFCPPPGSAAAGGIGWSAVAVISDSRATEAVAALKALDARGAVPNANLSYSEVLRTPARHLGAFASLPAPLQEQLRDFCRQE